MKIRILNGGHAAIAYAAGLMDIHFVHEAMADDLVKGFLGKVEHEEIIPTVPPVPGVDLTEYFATVQHRFANPKIGDTIRRLCLDGSNRQPKFIIPTIADRLAGGSAVSGLALEIGAVVPLLLRHDRWRCDNRTQRPQLDALEPNRGGRQG